MGKVEISVGFDGSENSAVALRWAAMIASVHPGSSVQPYFCYDYTANVFVGAPGTLGEARLPDIDKLVSQVSTTCTHRRF